MDRLKMRMGCVAFVSGRALAAVVGTAVFAALAVVTPVRASDPDRAAAVAAETPQETDAYAGAGTGGNAAIRYQFEAFRDQCLAGKKQLLVGKITLDLLLENERFMLAADRECCATRTERAEATWLALIRLARIRKIVNEAVAAGRMTPADLDRAENQRLTYQNEARGDRSR